VGNRRASLHILNARWLHANGCRTTNFRQVICLRTCVRVCNCPRGLVPMEYIISRADIRHVTHQPSVTLRRALRDGTQSTRTIPIDIDSISRRPSTSARELVIRVTRVQARDPGEDTPVEAKSREHKGSRGI